VSPDFHGTESTRTIPTGVKGSSAHRVLRDYKRKKYDPDRIIVSYIAESAPRD
jgi:hypothetical protein